MAEYQNVCERFSPAGDDTEAPTPWGEGSVRLRPRVPADSGERERRLRLVRDRTDRRRRLRRGAASALCLALAACAVLIATSSAGTTSVAGSLAARTVRAPSPRPAQLESGIEAARALASDSIRERTAKPQQIAGSRKETPPPVEPEAAIPSAAPSPVEPVSAPAPEEAAAAPASPTESEFGFEN